MSALWHGPAGWRRLIALMVCAGLGACHPANERDEATRDHRVMRAPPPAPVPRETPTPEPMEFDQAQGGNGRYPMHSTVAEIHFTAITRLPRAMPLPAPTLARDGDAWCAGQDIAPRTAGAKLARSLGWHIISEAAVGRLTVVAIARGYGAWRSCVQVDGVLALFDGAQAIGVVQRDDRLHAGFGYLEKLESGALLVHIWQVGAPLGELSLVGRTLRFSAIAAVATYCGGRAKVPNIYRMNIMQARRVLFRYGWRPYRDTPIDRESIEYNAYYRHGVTEIEVCDKYCQFRYISPAGMLSFGVGWDESNESPDYDNVAGKDLDTDPGGDVVSGYQVDCRARRGK